MPTGTDVREDELQISININFVDLGLGFVDHNVGKLKSHDPWRADAGKRHKRLVSKSVLPRWRVNPHAHRNHQESTCNL